MSAQGLPCHGEAIGGDTDQMWPGNAPAMSYDGGEQRATADLQLLGDLGGEEGNEDLQENREVTLDAWVLAAVTEEVGDGGELAPRVAAGEEEDGIELVNRGAPARFLRHGGRGRRGGDGGGLRSALQFL